MQTDRTDLKLLSGDRIVVNRMTYGVRMPFVKALGYHRVGGGKPEVGEIVAFDYPDGSSNISVDRVSGIPGDTIWLKQERDAFFVVPECTFSVGEMLLPESCLIGHPVCVSFSVDSARPVFRKLRSKRFFIPIE